LSRDKRDFFVLRLKIPYGQVNSDQLPKIARIAKKNTAGKLHFTTRQGVKSPWIESTNIEEAKKATAAIGLTIGVSSPRPRVITARMGNSLLEA
jgi:anaerobic sulfite reductase subunit C